MQLLADRTMASAIGNASRRALAPGIAQWMKAGLSQVIGLVAALPSEYFDLGSFAWLSMRHSAVQKLQGCFAALDYENVNHTLCKCSQAHVCSN